MEMIANESNFKEAVSKDLVLVDFFATWCGPCRMISPILTELAEEQTDVKIIKIDVDENRNLAAEYGVMSIPTLILFKDGKPISVKNGFLPKELLEVWIEENK
ncbi:Thioredoxin [compost metagenome]